MRAAPLILPALCACALLVLLPGRARAARALMPEAGRPLTRTYSAGEAGATDDVRCAVQGLHGIMFFGTRGAVLEFDGENWRRLPVPAKGFVHRLAATPDGAVWLVADGEVGRFHLTATGGRTFESLTEKLPAEARESLDASAGLITAGGTVWLSTRGALFHWEKNAFQRHAFPGEAALRLFKIGPAGGVAHSSQRGIFRLDGNEPVPLSPPLQEKRPLSLLIPLGPSGRWLFAAEGGALQITPAPAGVDGPAFPVPPVENIASGAPLPDGGWVLLPRNASVLVFDDQWRLRLSAGASEGVPVGRVHAVYADRSHGIWLCTGFGVVRIENRSGAAFFDARNGIELTPQATQARGRAGTSGETEEAEAGSLTAAQLLLRDPLVTDLFRAGERLFIQLSDGGMRSYDHQRVRFGTVPGLGAARASWRVPTGILFNAGGDTRLWRPRASNALHIASGESCRGAATLDADQFVFATDKALVRARREGDAWKPTAIAHGVAGPLLRADPETAETWWLKNEAGLYRLRLDGDRATAPERYDLPPGLPPESTFTIQRHGGETIMLTEAGLWRFEPAARRFAPWSKLGADLADRSHRIEDLVIEDSGRAWVIARSNRYEHEPAVVFAIDPDGRRRELSSDIYARVGRPLKLRLDPDAAEGTVLWIIGSAALGRIDVARWLAGGALAEFPVNLRAAAIVGGAPLALDGPPAGIVQAPRTLRLSYAAARFPLTGRVEYQTWLEGLEPEWSDWQATTLREFTHLPVGRYTFHVRARHDTATGRAPPLSFAILPPWWRTPAALALWTLGTGGAIFGLIRWRMRALRTHNEELGRLVAARTAELTASEEQLRVTRDAAEAANRAKSTFLAHMSHELRTPLNGILGYAQVLRRDPAQNAHARERLGVIVDSGEHLLALINEVLDLAKVEAGKMELRPTDVSLERLARGVADLVRARCEEKSLAFDVQLAPGLPRLVRTDEQKLRQALLNLLGNAIKFTTRGRVALGIAPVADGRVRFAVDDTGPGISADRLTTLFTAFDSTAAQAAHGTGLGLALSQRMIELLGGRVQVTSTLGAGSRFWFDLPLPEMGTSEPFGAAATARVVDGYQGPRRRVLVVDDEPVNRAVLRELLENLGFVIDEAVDAAGTLRGAGEIPPDAILLDLRFVEGPDGFAIARQLRADARFARAKIIAVSASVFESDRHEALAAGCDAFLAKPFKEEQLFHVLGSVLSLEWTHANVAAPAPADAAPLPEAIRVELLDLARRGDARRLRARLAEIAIDPVHAALARQLDELAAGFQMKRIREILSEKGASGG